MQRLPCHDPMTLVSRRCGRTVWSVPPELADELLATHGLRLKEWRQQGRVEVVKTGRHRTVYRLNLRVGRFYSKHYKVPDWRAMLQNLVQPCKAKCEWRAATQVAAVGIDTMCPVAVGWTKHGPWTTDSWFLSREIEDVQTVHDFVTDSLGRLPSAQRTAVRRQLAVRLGELTGRLHGGGLLHRDFHAGNLLIRRLPDDSLRLWLIDLHALAVRRRLRLRQIERNLALLSHFFSHASTRTDRLRFFRSYWNTRQEAAASGQSPLRWVSGQNYRRVVRRIESFCNTSLLRTFRKGDRKWLRENRRLIIADTKHRLCRGVTWLGRDCITEIRNDPERLFADGNVRSYRCSFGTLRKARLALRVGLRTIPCVAIAVQTSRWADRARRWTRYSVLRQSWEVGHAFLRRGIPCAQPLLVVESASGSTTHQYLLTEDLPDAVPLSEFLQTEFDRLSGSQREAWLANITSRLAGHIRKLHDCGFEHQQLSAETVLVARTASECRAWFRGLDAVRFGTWASPRQKALQLGRLAAGLLLHDSIRHTHRLRFLKRYLGERFSQDWKRWWRYVDRHVQRLSNANSETEWDERGSAAA